MGFWQKYMESVNELEKIQSYYESNMTREKLLHNINSLKCVLNNNVIEYLMALLNLEISALQRDPINEQVVKNLMQYEWFGCLVTYNIQNRFLKLIADREKEYDKSMYHGLDLCFNNKQIFSLRHMKPVSVNLWNTQLMSIKEKKAKLENFRNILKDIASKNGGKIYIPEPSMIECVDIGNSADPGCEAYNKHCASIYEVNRKREIMQQYVTKYETEEALYREHELEKQLVAERKYILNLVLNDNNLDLKTDFKKQKNKEYIKSYGYADLYINK